MSRTLLSDRTDVKRTAWKRQRRPRRPDHHHDYRLKAAAWLCTAWVLCFGGPTYTLHSQTTPVPSLDFEAVDDNNVVISWPDIAPGFILQESDSPGDSSIWRGILQTPAASTGRLKVTRAIGGSTVRMFYRIRKKGANPGLDYLVSTQAPAGTWGDPTRALPRDTAAALEALALYGRNDNHFYNGLAALTSIGARNNDETSRKAVALASVGYDISALLAGLLAGQGPEAADAASLSFPGRGWGLAAGFGSSTIDTALVLRALRAVGPPGGLAVANEQIGASSSSALHPFTIPAGASGVLMKIRSVTGGTLRFNLTPPASGALFVDVSPASAPITITGLPSTAGQWTLQVQNQGAATCKYSAEIAYTDSAGFDLFRVTTPLLFLGLTQNTDGGWGIARSEDSHLMITAEVFMTLAGWGNGFVGPSALSGGSNWLIARKNADGGFSSVPGSSGVNETALAMLALRAASPGTSLATAAAFLKSAQLPDGSWGSDPYLTAAAVKALYLPPHVAPIPDQTVVAPSLFTQIQLDNFVTDPDHADNQLSWTVAGNSQLTVTLLNRVATITYPPATSVSEVLTFTATDPDGFDDSASARFTVNYQLVDYTIAHGGTVTGSRNFSGASSVLDQAAFYSENQVGVPTGVTYTTTSFGRVSAIEFQVGFQISVGPAATTGIASFQIQYGLLNSASNPLGPLSGNVFNFSINITP